MNEVFEYLRVFYSDEIVITNDFCFQEKLRIRAAQSYTDTDLCLNGREALQDIEKALKEEDKDQPITDIYKQYLARQIENGSLIVNVRKQVKNAWTYPLKGFLPWKPVDHPKILQHIESLNQNGRMGVVRVVNQKLYLVLDDIVCPKDEIQPFQDLNLVLRPNFETQHITLLNSEVLASYPEKAETLPQTEIHDLYFSDPKHTISLDWARFSVCVVVMVQSHELQRFMLLHFPELKARDQYHLTLFVLPR